MIAEFKRRSPSAGTLRENADLHEMLDAYERGGAVAFSVLTEEANFDGRLEDLREARTRHRLPVLRKDFIVDPYQLHEARSAGADAVLLIVAALSQEELVHLAEQARELSLDVLVEVHDAARAGAGAGGGVAGDRDQQPRPARLQRRRVTHRTAAGADPEGRGGRIGVGHRHGRRSCAGCAQAGVAAVLMGESLMRAPDPAQTLRALLDGLQGGPD